MKYYRKNEVKLFDSLDELNSFKNNREIEFVAVSMSQHKETIYFLLTYHILSIPTYVDIVYDRRGLWTIGIFDQNKDLISNSGFYVDRMEARPHYWQHLTRLKPLEEEEEGFEII